MRRSRSWEPRFDAIYASSGRPSIAPEKLLRALLLQVLYTVRSERMLMEQLDYNFLFRWFVGLSIDEPVWDATVFTKNRERLLEGEVAEGFFTAVLDQARAQGLLSDEHFTVDGTLIEAWAGHKSFKRKDDRLQDPARRSRQSQRRLSWRATQQRHSPIDHRSRGPLARKGAGKEAKLSYAGHVLMENRNGIAVQRLRDPGHRPRRTAGGHGDGGKDSRLASSHAGRRQGLRPQANWFRSCAITRSPRTLPASPPLSSMSGPLVIRAIAISQRKRKRIEEIFGWLKTVAGLRKTRHRGVARVGWMFTFALAAYNLVRMRNLAAA